MIEKNYEGFPGSLGFVHIAPHILRYDNFVALLAKPLESPTLNALHGAVGISGEAGELLDAIKKIWVYNKDVDRTNIVEELGDIRFYMQLVMNTYGITEQEVLDHNATKLSIRYKQLTYSDSAAQERADKKTS